MNVKDEARKSEPGTDSKRIPKRIALYLRGLSKSNEYIDYQEKNLRAEVERINQTIPFGNIVAVYIDKGWGLDSFSNPRMKALMSAVGDHQIDMIMVAEFRDLAIIASEFIEILLFLDRHRCALRNASEYLLYGRPDNS